jgi:hypothetical protein
LNFLISSHMSFAMGGCDILRTLGVCHTPPFKYSKVTFPKVSDLLTRTSWRPTTMIYFVLQLFSDLYFFLSENSQSTSTPESQILYHPSPCTKDGSEWLQDFGTSASPISCALSKDLRLVHFTWIRWMLIPCAHIQWLGSVLLLGVLLRMSKRRFTDPYLFL